MKRYLVLFTCAENSPNHQKWKNLDSKTQTDLKTKGNLALENWIIKFESQIIYDGGSIGQTKEVSEHGVKDLPSYIGRFMIVDAKSISDAAQMFVDHPHFTHFPGDGIEVLEFKDNN